MVTRRRTTATRTTASPLSSFTEWLQIRDEAENLSDRQETLRQRILKWLAEKGEEDDKGSSYYELPQPLKFTDRFGKVFLYKRLKRERHLTPADPPPDPELAEALLRKKKLWLTPAQEKQIRELQLALPYARLSLAVDPDAVAILFFKDIITEKEYEGILKKQTESFQFKPSE